MIPEENLKLKKNLFERSILHIRNLKIVSMGLHRYVEKKIKLEVEENVFLIIASVGSIGLHRNVRKQPQIIKFFLWKIVLT